MASRTLAFLSGNRAAQGLFEYIVKRTHKYMGVGSGDDVRNSGEKAVFRRMQRLLPPPYRVFDVGANVGQFLKVALANIHGTAYQIHCFEPSPQAFALLEESAREYDTVTLNAVGLGKAPGEATLYSNRPGSPIASLSYRRLDHLNIDFSQTQTVRIDTLDNYCATRRIDRIDLLKVDVEGHELDVFQAGGKQTFEKQAVKMVIFEFGGCNIDTRTFVQDFFYFFRQAGMRLFRITPSGYFYPISKYDEQLEQFRTTNFLAIHKSVRM